MDQYRTGGSQTLLYSFALICSFGVILSETKLYGLHSDELKSGELIIPRRVNADGKFLTNKLSYYHQRDHRHDRRRRSTLPGQLEETTAAAAYQDDPNEIVHYQLQLSNETLHLELEPHSYFITPHIIVERHRRDLRRRSTPKKRHLNCYFHGSVRGHETSNVAIATCGGLVGHIKTSSNEYFIEPSKFHGAHATNGHPHVVFQRSSVNEKLHKNKQINKDNNSNNNNNNNNNNSNNKLKKKRRQRKRKQHQKQHRQQHSKQQQQQLQQEHKKYAAAAATIITTTTTTAAQQATPKSSSAETAKTTQALAAVTTTASRVSNCGTKEPRSRTETRLEWQSQGKVKIQGGRKIRRQHQLQQQQHQQQQQQDKIKFKYRTENEQKPQQQQPHKTKITTNAASSSSPSPSLSSNSDLASDGANAAIHVAHRTKRSISSPRHVETLLVADATMIAFHGNFQVETYLLTIMNMVSALYKDPSIGNSIEIVVVKIILLEEDEAHPDLNLTQNAQKNLDKFCSWQHKLYTLSEHDPHHHDVAILITRKNICGNNCMTLGLANVGGMCKPKQSCSVNEDNGIMLSHTITHELGHNFGMFHDTAKIGCHPRVGSIVHIMTPTFGADTLQVSWSNCSRKYITHFLDQGLGECLDDSPTPHDQYNYPEILPGELYPAERQCRMQFNLTDGDVGACSSPHEICETLWCRVNGECVTNMRPTAPGTSCGPSKWCQNGQCVPMQELTPINGGWGNWSEWSECSRSCGGGVSIQQRECDNPVPVNGGVFCIGARKRYKICKKKPCPEQEPSFRARQCTRYDNVTYQGGIYKWLPFFDKDNPCKLYCSDVDDTIIANWGETVLDGTPCTLGTNNMCIDGICKKVGCDWIVDSDMQEDRCGICGGAGDQCQPVRQVYSEPFNITDGYVEIITIPAKARHILIKELANTANFIGVARANSAQFYLNGDSLISMPGEFVIAGAESLYDRIDEQETIKIPQPIQHAIAIYVIVRVNETNEGIYYEFTLPAVNVSANKQFQWKLSEWTACSTTCGGGVQYREPVCYENGKLSDDNLHCWTHAKNKRPLRQARTCSEQPCPAQWWTGPWQYCPVTCRQVGMPHPVKRRSVMCLDQHDVVVTDAECSQLARPPETEYCDQHLPNCKER